MEPTIQVEESDCIPTDATVCHYDELAEDAKHRFPCLVSGESQTTGLAPAVGRELAACDYVKFTSYYRVQTD